MKKQGDRSGHRAGQLKISLRPYKQFFLGLNNLKKKPVTQYAVYRLVFLLEKYFCMLP